MAEIQQQGDSGGKGGKKRAKKMSTKIDMTPMVDLAFLLLTFFMLTTTFSKPNVMDLNMPVKKRDVVDDTQIKASNAFTVIAGANNKLYYYAGLLDATARPELKLTSYATNGIRQELLSRKQANPELVILIKLDDKATYKNMVDILDEMNITNQNKFAIVDITKLDQDLVKDSKL
jgi:biopolymer transport protein ExbD